MPNPVYDDQKTTSDEDLRKITGIDEEQEASMDREGANGAANDILGRERAAGAGKIDAHKQTHPNNTSPPGGKISEGGAAAAAAGGGGSARGSSRQDLKSKESDVDLYKPESEDDGGKSSGRKGRIRKNIALAGIIGGGVGGGAGFALFGIISGPLQFIHMGQLLTGFHFDEKNTQSTSRALRAIRNARYVINGEQQKTRMGTIGNKIANAVEAKMNARGISSDYDAGRFTGYTVDPEKLSSTDYKDLTDRSPEGVQKYFQEKYNINLVNQGGRLVALRTGGYFVDVKLNNKIIQAVGGKAWSPLSTRAMTVRTGSTLFPIKKMLQKGDEKLKAWVKMRYDYITKGSSPPRVGVQVAEETDEDGKPVANEDADSAKATIDELQADGQKASADLANGDSGSFDKFKATINSKYFGAGAAVTGIVGLLCLIKALAENIDVVNYANVIMPMIRMAMAAISFGDQIKDGKTVDEQQVGYMANSLFGTADSEKVLAAAQNRKAQKSSWSSAKSIESELGKTGGTEIPEGAKLDPKGNILSKIVDVFQPEIGVACAALEGVVGILITAVFAIVSPLTTLVTTALSIIFLPIIIDQLARIFASAIIPPLAAGTDFGNFTNYGARRAAKDTATTHASLPIDDAVDQTLKKANLEDQQTEFRNKSLASRLFDTTDAHSLIGQVLDTQAPDPATNVTNVALGILNIGKSFGSTIAKPLLASAGAAPLIPYDYGFPDSAYTPDELNDEDYENPYQNADLVSDILDANTEAEEPTVLDPVSGVQVPNMDNYIVRAKMCFGVTIAKIDVRVADNPPYQQYTIKPPVTGAVPKDADVVEPAHKCLYGHVYTDPTHPDDTHPVDGNDPDTGMPVQDWTRIRFFIFDSSMLDSMMCNDGPVDDDDTKQACIDVGLEPDPNGGGGGGDFPNIGGVGVPSCATTAVSQAPPGYTLTNCADFSTTLDADGWGAYDDPGEGDTVRGGGRIPSQCVVKDDLLYANQATDGSTCGSSSDFGQKYGYWEVRMLAAQQDTGGASTHPVLLLWPDAGDWPEGGEYDYFETDMGDDADGYLHCASGEGGNCVHLADIIQKPIPYAEYSAAYHNWGFEWRPDGYTGRVDGTVWWTSSDGGSQAPRPMHETVQNDAFDGPPMNASSMQVDWVHVYCKTGTTCSSPNGKDEL